MKSEQQITQEIQLEVSKLGGRVFRNQTGKYKVGDRWISSGLCVGSSDLIGWFKRIEFDTVQDTAVFLAIEVKTAKGHIRPEQIKFINCVKEAGGIAFIARSVEDVRRELCDQ